MEVLPAVVLFATFAVARASRTWRYAAIARSARPALRMLLPALLMTAALVPAVPVYAQLAPLRTELGEPRATAAGCQTLRPNDSVILLDPWWAPTIRDEGGLPVAMLTDPPLPRMHSVVAAVRATDREPVLLASTMSALAPHGVTVQKVVDQWEQHDQHQLLKRPNGLERERLQCWLARP
ncbi:hypothetical protein ACQP2P_12640 [Dactylosporangium sp. CA-139114]|uniref:hypothetical protein n=1 Tax=Dactylosporangium sp. CA-139114 TaxID=3239931 RepID=UPI003D988C48